MTGISMIMAINPTHPFNKYMPVLSHYCIAQAVTEQVLWRLLCSNVFETKHKNWLKGCLALPPSACHPDLKPTGNNSLLFMLKAAESVFGFK